MFVSDSYLGISILEAGDGNIFMIRLAPVTDTRQPLRFQQLHASLPMPDSPPVSGGLGLTPPSPSVILPDECLPASLPKHWSLGLFEQPP